MQYICLSTKLLYLHEDNKNIEELTSVVECGGQTKLVLVSGVMLIGWGMIGSGTLLVSM